ncbi:MAG: arginine--tRNA ligase, partial [Nitrospirae bacterium]
AEEIVDKIKKLGADDFEKIEIAGPGFINFTFKDSYFYKAVNEMIERGSLKLDDKRGRGKKVLIEFVSANPTGPLHFGHGRGAALGDAIAKLLKRAGYEVEKEFYINDAGRQVELLGESIYAAYQRLRNREFPFPEDGYKGEYIKDAAEELMREKGEEFIGIPFSECKEFFIDWSCSKMLDLIKNDLELFGVSFDKWKSERELFSSGRVDEVIEELKEKGYTFEKDGALWFRSTSFGDEKDRVLIKSDGTYTYFSSDIAYHKEKMERAYDLLINIWGADHHGYIPRIRAAISALGYDDKILKILLVQMVNLLKHGKPMQMSKREGSFITLREVIDEVGADTAKFIFLTRRPDSHLDFDLDVAKEQSSENPVFYVQYAYARIRSVIAKAGSFDPKEADLKLLKLPEELRILKKICIFPIIFDGAVVSLEPHRITYYLQQLAGEFHSYYNSYRIISDDRALTLSRLAFIVAIQFAIKEGLEILGVNLPERM